MGMYTGLLIRQTVLDVVQTAAVLVPIAAVLCNVGCVASLPPAVGLPARQVAADFTFSDSYGFAEARIRGEDGIERTVVRNGDRRAFAWGSYVATAPIPRAVGVRVPLVSGSTDIGARVSLERFALSGRHALSSTTGTLPIVLGAELGGDPQLLSHTHDASLRLTFFPAITNAFRAILGVNGSIGSFRHDVSLTYAERGMEVPELHTIPTFERWLSFVREETRLAVALGGRWEIPKGAFSLFLEPYWVARHGAPERVVVADLVAFSQQFGTTLTASFELDHWRR